MHIKVDEDLPTRCVALLKEFGYAASSVPEQGLKGAKDAVLWTVIQQQGYFFITADKGFGDIRAYPPGTHQGILLLRPAREGTNAYLEILREALQSTPLRSLQGAVAVASPRGLRVRRVP